MLTKHYVSLSQMIRFRYDYERFSSDGYGKDHFLKSIEADMVDAESEGEIKDNLDDCLRVMEKKLQTFDRVRKDKDQEDDLTEYVKLHYLQIEDTSFT